ncbi:MAG TPA: lycopene cyclase family protein [Sandaracinaceae bacterium LLY-WYZ-13_1]|nr:lycopene cyclase family protein [Sandaracinaceae bacterium LLY-WYZ-13_1]
MSAPRPPAPPPSLGSPDAPFDHVLVGAGCAGLSLAVQLSRAFPEARTLLVDPGFGDVDDRTFAFWCEGEPPLAGAVEHSWSRIRLAAPSRQVEGRLTRHRYHVIGGVGFREACFAALEGDGRTFLRLGRADEVVTEDHRAVVRGPGLEVHARWAFDSRLDGAEPPPDPRHVAVRQRFLGWEVETEVDTFDPGEVVLFDFRTDQGEGDVRFVYVLPWTARRALVEHVAMHECDAKGALRAYLAEVHPGVPYRIARVEAGDSPLTDAPFVRRAGPRVLRVGIAGGRLKPSSGYAFVRIWEDAAAIVASLRDAGHPFELPADGPGFRLLDGLLLRVMEGRPASMPHVFLRMFERNPPDRVLSFLDERVGLSEVLSLGTRLPIAPFAEALSGSLRARIAEALRRLTAPIEYED